MTTTDEQTRTAEIAINVKATPAEVWQALTDAEKLKSWFPIDARVEPGVGGSIWVSWGEICTDSGPIQIWEPDKHLRWQWGEDNKIHAMPTVVDFFIEGKGGETTLRVVHSGFGRGAKWDEMYDGVQRGWYHELRSLKHYLEVHPGKKRDMRVTHRAIDGSFEQAWSKLLGPDGFGAGGSLDVAEEGGRFSITTAWGEKMTGLVQVHRKPTDLALIVDELNRALLRIHVDHTYKGDGKTHVHVWIGAWDVPAETVQRVHGHCDELLTRLYGK